MPAVVAQDANVYTGDTGAVSEAAGGAEKDAAVTPAPAPPYSLQPHRLPKVLAQRLAAPMQLPAPPPLRRPWRRHVPSRRNRALRSAWRRRSTRTSPCPSACVMPRKLEMLLLLSHTAGLQHQHSGARGDLDFSSPWPATLFLWALLAS